MQPSIGRIVHYRPPGGYPCTAAIVTQVSPDLESVSLAVFGPPFTPPPPEQLLMAVRQDEDRADQLNGTWHWPERTES